MDLVLLLTWYIFFLVAGIIGLPLSKYLFSKWIDKGYIFSKVIGLFITSIPIWFLSSLQIIPFNQTISIIWIIICLVVSIYFLYKQNFRLRKIFLLEELIFFIIIAYWSFARSTNPRIEGTEKMMNLAFMNSIMRTEYFPPADPWYQGGDINYYYIGHYMFTFVGQVCSIPAKYAYNFALVTIISQTFVSLFSIIMRLGQNFINYNKKLEVVVKDISDKYIKRIATKFNDLFHYPDLSILTFISLTISTVVIFGGNLHYAYKFVEHNLTGSGEFSYYFPDPTRIISFAIDEFPAYSVVLADVHPHYIVLPFLTLTIAFAIVSYNIKLDSVKKIYFNIIISPFIVFLYGINSWDFITASVLFAFIYIAQIINYKDTLKEKIEGIYRSLISAIFLFLPGALLLLPYILNFDPPVGGETGLPIGLVPLWTDSIINKVYTDLTTPSSININSGISDNLFRLLNLILILGSASLIFLVNKKNILKKFSKRWIFVSISIAIIALVMIIDLLAIGDIRIMLDILGSDVEPYVTFKSDIGNWFLMWGVPISFFILYIIGAKINAFRKISQFQKNVSLVLLILGIGLIFGVEFIFFKDIFHSSNSPFFRTNTVFKFYYHAWIITGILCGFVLINIVMNIKRTFKASAYQIFSIFISSIVILSSVSYIFTAIDDYYFNNVTETITNGDVEKSEKPKTLDGNRYIREEYPEDYAVINWINENIEGQPVILEAVGDAYTYYSRISTNTGLITVIGWPTHEWQWRGDSVTPFERKSDVELIYTTEDINTAAELIDDYQISYILVGGKEREAYPNLIESNFTKLSTLIFEEGDTKLYKVSN